MCLFVTHTSDDNINIIRVIKYKFTIIKYKHSDFHKGELMEVHFYIDTIDLFTFLPRPIIFTSDFYKTILFLIVVYWFETYIGRK